MNTRPPEQDPKPTEYVSAELDICVKHDNGDKIPEAALSTLREDLAEFFNARGYQIAMSCEGCVAQNKVLHDVFCRDLMKCKRDGCDYRRADHYIGG